MSDPLINCFLVKSNAHGEKATHAKHAHQPGDLVYVVRGEVQAERTRQTIEVAPGQHVHDTYAEFINHSFGPNLEVRGRELVAIREIAPGDELTFDYLRSESSIAAPFVCHDTGRPVDSQGCGDAADGQEGGTGPPPPGEVIPTPDTPGCSGAESRG